MRDFVLRCGMVLLCILALTACGSAGGGGGGGDTRGEEEDAEPSDIVAVSLMVGGNMPDDVAVRIDFDGSMDEGSIEVTGTLVELAAFSTGWSSGETMGHTVLGIMPTTTWVQTTNQSVSVNGLDSEGKTFSGFYASYTVTAPVCGDGYVSPTNTPSEQCDDANTSSGDGCSDTCQDE